MTTDADRIARLEARVEAMSATIKTVLSTLVLRGTLTKAAVEAILKESEQQLHADPTAVNELNSVREDMPRIIRAALGPEPDPDDHGGH